MTQRVRAGIARSFQLVNVFDDLTAFDNVALAIFSREGKTARLGTLAHLDHAVTREADAILGQFGLAAKRDGNARDLAQGERKLLDVALAYSMKPKLLFLDEPTSGVSTRDKGQIMDTIASVVRAEGITAVIVEHDMDVVFKYSDRIVVMAQGAILAQGTPDEIRKNEQVAMVAARHLRPRRVHTKGLTPVLEVKAIDTYRGPAHILHGVSLSVGAKEVVCLVGRNGAGKTTTIESIMGFLPVRAGQIELRRREPQPPAAARARQARHRLFAGGLRRVPRAVGGREPDDQPLARRGGGEEARRPARRSRGAGVRRVPGGEGPARPPGPAS